MLKDDFTIVYSLDSNNIGDICSNPSLYFDYIDVLKGYKARSLSVNRKNIYKYGEKVIFGGGGLFPNFINKKHLRYCLINNIDFFVWGAGYNLHNKNITELKIIDYDSRLLKGKLVGMRDFGGPFRYVPCSSCLFPNFKNARQKKPKDRIIIYEHKDFKMDIDEKFRRKNNRFCINKNLKKTKKRIYKKFSCVLDFLASGDIIITNSYHGVYWGLLLGRKVLLYKPFSSKFSFLKIKVPVCDKTNWMEKVKDIESYYKDINIDGYLDECIDLNRNFAKDLYDQLS